MKGNKVMYTYNQPVKILHGAGILEKLGEEAIQYGNKAFIVTGKTSAHKTGLIERVKEILLKSSIEYVIFNRAESNPLTTTAMIGAKVYKEEGCDFVLGIGGGSAMDCAKAIAFLTENEGDISDYIMGIKQGENAAPILLVTTTAGTGSEANSLAVLTNPENNDKKSLKHPSIYAKVSFVDPELMVTLPTRFIASCGFDAFTHCYEAFIANRSTPESAALALEGIEMIFENLVNVYHDPTDIQSFSKVAHANTLGGIAIDMSGVNLNHGLEHPVSGLLDASHGEGLAALFIPTFEYTKDKVREKLIKIGELITDKSATDDEKVESTCKKIKSILEEIDLNITLTDLGVKEKHINWLTENAFKTMNYAITNNPIIATHEDVKEIYKKCL
ncbi:MAG: alcohol dehydrogenase [Firmicutes bacterium HGW-Firmicutes-7]|nr:MAG: alcohol dehydrogenase [Firmicutes bacterium HGW-Firmicutes-7]